MLFGLKGSGELERADGGQRSCRCGHVLFNRRNARGLLPPAPAGQEQRPFESLHVLLSSIHEVGWQSDIRIMHFFLISVCHLRLTPVYAAVLGFAATLWTRLGSGPDWAYVHYVSETCREKWWIHMLYLNNYVIQSSTSMIVIEFN